MKRSSCAAAVIIGLLLISSSAFGQADATTSQLPLFSPEQQDWLIATLRPWVIWADKISVHDSFRVAMSAGFFFAILTYMKRKG